MRGAFLEQGERGAGADGARILDRTEMAPLTLTLTRSCCFPRHHNAAGTVEHCSWYEAGLVSDEGTNVDGTVSSGTTLVARSIAGAGQYSPEQGSADSTPPAMASCGAAAKAGCAPGVCAASATTLLAAPPLSANQRWPPASAQGEPRGRRR